MPRRYAAEYKKYHSSTEQKRRRASRNAARSKMTKAGRVRKGDGKDVSHRNGNPMDNRRRNLKPVAASKNRSFKRTSTARKVSKRA